MRKGISVILCILAVGTQMSCRKKMTPDEYVKYVTDTKNGLRKTISTDGWVYDVQYRPCDYVILMENRAVIADSLIKKRERELNGTAWFNISIKRADNNISPLRYGISSIEGYNARLEYFLNLAVKDIQLVYGNDTLSPQSYLFENNFNLTPQETMVVGFALPDSAECPERDMQLSYTDRIFKNGIIRASFPSKITQKAPDLIF